MTIYRMNKQGLLIVYSGPSGVGKGTIINPYIRSHEQMMFSVSATSRAPRPNETDGVDYHFISRQHFIELTQRGEMLEYTEYNGNYYGTPKKKVEQSLREGIDVVLEIEVRGAAQVRAVMPNALFIFIMPPTYQDLEKRLLGRGTEDVQTIAERLKLAKFELSKAVEYDYIIVNDTVAQATEKLSAIISAAKCKTEYLKEFIEEVYHNA